MSRHLAEQVLPQKAAINRIQIGNAPAFQHGNAGCSRSRYFEQ
jgi:hypothetical protein